MSVITIPKSLRERLGEEASEAFVDVINRLDVESKKELATKADVAAVKADIAAVKAELKTDIAAVKADLELVEARLDRKIEAAKSETLKWMFIFWAGQIIAIFAMFKALVK